jgi:hypothetical protein
MNNPDWSALDRHKGAVTSASIVRFVARLWDTIRPTALIDFLRYSFVLQGELYGQGM